MLKFILMILFSVSIFSQDLKLMDIQSALSRDTFICYDVKEREDGTRYTDLNTLDKSRRKITLVDKNIKSFRASDDYADVYEIDMWDKVVRERGGETITEKYYGIQVSLLDDELAIIDRVSRIEIITDITTTDNTTFKTRTKRSILNCVF